MSRRLIKFKRCQLNSNSEQRIIEYLIRDELQPVRVSTRHRMMVLNWIQNVIKSVSWDPMRRRGVVNRTHLGRRSFIWSVALNYIIQPTEQIILSVESWYQSDPRWGLCWSNNSLKSFENNALKYNQITSSVSLRGWSSNLRYRYGRHLVGDKFLRSCFYPPQLRRVHSLIVRCRLEDETAREKTGH